MFVWVAISVIIFVISTMRRDCSESCPIISLLLSVPLQISSISEYARVIFLSFSAVSSFARSISPAICALLSERFFRLSEICAMLSSTVLMWLKFASLSRITFEVSAVMLRFASVEASEIRSSSVTVSSSLCETSSDFSRIMRCCSAPIRFPSIDAVRFASIEKMQDMQKRIIARGTIPKSITRFTSVRLWSETKSKLYDMSCPIETPIIVAIVVKRFSFPEKNRLATVIGNIYSSTAWNESVTVQISVKITEQVTVTYLTHSPSILSALTIIVGAIRKISPSTNAPIITPRSTVKIPAISRISTRTKAIAVISITFAAALFAPRSFSFNNSILFPFPICQKNIYKFIISRMSIIVNNCVKKLLRTVCTGY